MSISHFVNNGLSLLTKHKEELSAIGAALGIGGTIAKAYGPTKQRFSAWAMRHRLQNLVGAHSYASNEIRSASSFYLYPDCQSIDPSGSEDWRALYPLRAPLFKTIDELLTANTDHRHTIVLADSGMGKTSFVLNYYARHLRSKRGTFVLELIHLGSSNADELLCQIKTKKQLEKVVVMLDAFDEDTRAIDNHRGRIGQLLSYTEGCRHVLITCRTQFFLRDDEIPRDTGILRVGVTRAGQSKEYQFYKIYLSPFSDHQIRTYLKKKISVFRPRDRKLAFDICQRIEDLAVRPMLLDYIPTLLKRESDWRYACQIYEEVVAAWILRERSFFVDGGTDLLEFSERLAVNLYTNREARGSETIDPEELEPLATLYGLPLKKWQLTGRSLLNRTVDGRYKFAHRSILEFLFARRFMTASTDFNLIAWTDQMKRFFIEMILTKIRNKEDLAGVHFENADLDGWERLGWKAELEISRGEGAQQGNLPYIGRTFDTALKGDGILPPVMIKTFGGISIGSEAMRYILRETVGRDSSSKEALSEVTPLQEFRAICTFDLMSNRMWAKLPLTAVVEYDDVIQNIDLCNQAQLNGYGDWRLPSRAELRSVLNRHTLLSGIALEGVWCVDSSEFVPLPTVIGYEQKSDHAVRAGAVLLIRELWSSTKAN